ncbi:MAG: tRNA uridine-5-carboxymethylaminomethyl(34) synthesis GTPase MnmE [Bdellovibrionales bacterium]|nr:tRNA uridine-5-carboxymethylaminomethyl(34) synthesis GTPase MnmE [Bdellovibrionales bacterium]
MDLSFDTIVAPITAPGVGAIAVVRVSGPGTIKIAEALCSKAKDILAAPRSLVLSDIVYGGESIDSGMAVFFKGPESFTGEDSLELNLHGSPYIVARVLEAALSAGARMAEPGEFSKRAYLNGKLDLTQAEAIADLISAESDAQLRIAREQLGGKLSSALSELGDPLRNTLAEIEAYIDFPEEDIEPEKASAWLAGIEQVSSQIKTYLASFAQGRMYREGASVCLAGFPNVGKSSLLNALLGEDRAIVTEIAGTTRDHIEERISIDGLLVRLWDTAGLFDADDAHSPELAERLGIERSWEKLEQADLVLFVAGAADAPGKNLELRELVASKNPKLLTLINKSDLLSKDEQLKLGEVYGSCLFVSASSGAGLGELRSLTKSKLLGRGREGVLVSNERHAQALRKADASLASAAKAIGESRPPELVALDLRHALGALDDIVGVTDTEDILGRIFSKFCIGK